MFGQDAGGTRGWPDLARGKCEEVIGIPLKIYKNNHALLIDT